jgi:DNA polymerase-3 subunit alpha
MSALLTSERNDLDRISTLIQECQKMKLEVLPPDVNESFTFFSVVPKKNQIRFGLSAVKNVGTGIVETIVGERKTNGPYKSIEDFVTRVNTKDLNKKSLESLIKAGAFDNMEERNKLLQNMEMLLEYSRDSQKSKNSNQGGLFDGMNIKSSIRLEKAEAAPEKDKLAWEKELLGLFVSSHPLKNYKGFLEKKTTPISELSPSGSKKIRIGGIISKIKKIITKTGKPMLFVNIEDLTDKIEVVVFPKVIERKPTAFQENKIVLVSGRVDSKDGMLKLICEDVEEIIEA